MREKITHGEFVERLNAMRRVLDVQFQLEAAVANERDLRYLSRFEGMDKALTLALAGQKEALLKVEAATEKRFASVNEFRGSLADQQATLMPRVEASLRLDALQTEVARLSSILSDSSSKRIGMKDLWGFLVGGIGVLLAVWAFINK